MSHSTQCLESVVPLAMFLICFVKGFGSGSLSDNGDIGDLISDYGPLSNIGVSDARYWAQYWLPQTRTKFAISSQVSANYKKSEYTTGCLKYTTGCHTYNIVKYSVHQNVVKYKIPPNTKYAAKRPNFTKYQTPPNIQLNTTKYCEQQRICWKCVKRHSNPNCVSNHKRRLIGGLQISSFH